jgi:ABC-2 type transport system permease protein
LVFRRDYFGKFLDILITFTTWVVVFGYFVPQMGSESGYGLYIMVGAIASFGIFNIIGQSGVLINDIQGDRTISYLLILPVSSNVVFIYRALSWSIQSFFITIPLYFVGKALFWSQLNLLQINWVQLGVALITVNLFFGFFALWLVAMLYKVVDLNRVYFRFINPLFILGCYFYTWKAAFGISPWVGYVSLIDPFCYVMEISRAAILGPQDYIPFWASFAALWGFILVLGLHATKRLTRILDCL